MKLLNNILIALSFIAIMSCSFLLETFFKQPEVQVTGYTLLELPGDTASLEIDILVTNMDKRQVHVADVDYDVELEGISFPGQHANINMDIVPDSTIAMTLPFNMATENAMKILAKLDAGEELNFHVTGLFHVDDPIFKLFDLPLNVEGSAEVEAGYEDFYIMPSAEVLEMNGNFVQDGSDSYVFTFNVLCAIQNNDPRSATVSEVEYKVNIEGVESELHQLSNAYPNGLTLAGNGNDTLTLPIVLNLDATAGATLATALQDDNLDYVVEGSFHAIKVDTLDIDFILPLYLEGTINTSFLSTLFAQPSVEILGYSLLSLPSDTTFLEIDMLLKNNDSRTATIANVEYQCLIEGIEALEENIEINQTIGTTDLEISMPLTLLTSDAILLLEKLNAGQELDYQVTGIFHLDDAVLNQIDLPLNIEGSAFVNIGYEAFYTQPEINLIDIIGDFTKDASNNYTFDLEASCIVENKDSRSVTFSDVEYTVVIEGIRSETHLYSDTYAQSMSLEASTSDTLVLPLTIVLNESSGNLLAERINDGSIDYEILGLINVSHVNASPLVFNLPIALQGSTPTSIFNSLFKQPSIEITGYTLLELPGDTAHLEIDMLLTNNDFRSVHIYDVDYQAIIDGITALPEYVILDQTIPADTITLTMPLTLLTDDAIQLLDKLEEGESIPYSVTGTFHIDDPVLDQFDLPINISGEATVDVGYEDFYEQPEVTVTSIAGTYRINGFTSYKLDFNVVCDVHNMDLRSATIDEIEYTVTIEGVKSNKHYYSSAYSTDFVVAGDDTESLTLPVTFTLGLSGGAAMVAAIADGTVNYVVEGTFHVIKADGTTVDFILPLYVTGSVPATMVAN